jgi:hypothetical protein
MRQLRRTMDIVNQETSSRACLLDASFVCGPPDNVHGCMSLDSFNVACMVICGVPAVQSKRSKNYAHLKLLDERQLGFLGR